MEEDSARNNHDIVVQPGETVTTAVSDGVKGVTCVTSQRVTELEFDQWHGETVWLVVDQSEQLKQVLGLK